MRVISSKLRNQYCQWYSVAKEIMVTPDTKSQFVYAPYHTHQYSLTEDLTLKQVKSPIGDSENSGSMTRGWAVSNDSKNVIISSADYNCIAITQFRSVAPGGKKYKKFDSLWISDKSFTDSYACCLVHDEKRSKQLVGQPTGKIQQYAYDVNRLHPRGSGKAGSVLRQSPRPILSMTLAKDGEMQYAVNDQGEIFKCYAGIGGLKKVVKFGKPVDGMSPQFLELSPDGKTLWGGGCGFLKKFDISGQEILQQTTIMNVWWDNKSKLSLSPDEKEQMCVGSASEIQIRLTRDPSLILRTFHPFKHENIAAITMF